MVKLIKNGVYLVNGKEIINDDKDAQKALLSLGKAEEKATARKGTITYPILKSHNMADDMNNLEIRFDALTSHDITYVGIVQTARASGLEKFPVPYVLTNCHNSLCAVGGTINEDDHLFGLSAAKKYGGIYVPAHLAVIHQFMREMQAGCGKMILGSDSHTRYGAIGTMAIGEGGPELVKQILSKSYNVAYPDVVGVMLNGKPKKGVGPQDVALAIIGAVFESGFVKNKVMEFVGDGIANLNMDYRNGIDVMTTETTCLSSIWITDDKTKEYLEIHGRKDEYKQLKPNDVAYYDSMIIVDLEKIEPMIAMPFHPSNTYKISEVNENLEDILAIVEEKGSKQMGMDFKLRDKIVNGKLYVDQGIIAGCSGGTYDNIIDSTDIIEGCSLGSDAFSLAVYPSSQPVYISLVENGCISKLMNAGAVIKTAFCGPCFGAGDVPANGGLSIRHSTRNFPNREGSKPSSGQLSSVALMDARSIAATAAHGGFLTPATEIDVNFSKPKFTFNKKVYDNRVYQGFNKADEQAELKFGPNIAQWPEMSNLTDDILVKVASYIEDPVTTTDELIPSGETSSYRSNPEKLSEFTLSRKDPQYVARAKEIREVERERLSGKNKLSNNEIINVFEKINKNIKKVNPLETEIGTVVFAVKPGDGSAREQAASCQKVLGTLCNFATEYATKRYRSNLINWGMLPFIIENQNDFKLGDYIFIKDVKKAVEEKAEKITAYVIKSNTDEIKEINLTLPALTKAESDVILAGCLINYYKK
ncbi:MAG: hydratase [Clostridia bacterium]